MSDPPASPAVPPSVRAGTEGETPLPSENRDATPLSREELLGRRLSEMAGELNERARAYDEQGVFLNRCIADVQARLHAVERERDALREDKKRLDWLEEHSGRSLEDIDVARFRIRYHDGQGFVTSGFIAEYHPALSYDEDESIVESMQIVYRGPSLREAIDAARAPLVETPTEGGVCPRCQERPRATIARDEGDGVTKMRLAKWCHECTATP